MSAGVDALYRQAPADPEAWLEGLSLAMTIDGEDAATTCFGRVMDPCREVSLARYPDATVDHVDIAVAAARRAFADWAARPWHARRQALDHFADLIAVHHDDLAMIVAWESGRPLRRAWNEILYAIGYVRTIAAAELPPVNFDHPGLRAELVHRPLGVVAAIAPWNGPVILAVAKIANALLAGDTMILRPSPFTPLSALHLGRLGRQAFPPGVFNVITGDATVGAAMTTHVGVAKISFTGSTATGKRIAIAAAPMLKRLTLELGGNDAAIVLPGADVAAVAHTIFEISLGNAGHFCAAVKRLYVHEDVYDELRSALTERAHTAVLGPNFDPSTTMGPVQNRPQFDRIWALIDDAVAQGGRAVCGGGRMEQPGLFIPPTLIEGIEHGVALVDEEQFGPVLPLLPFRDVADAVRMANDNEYGLGGSVWTGDIEHGLSIARQLEVGTAWVNQHGAFNAALPMPFAKQSGIGIDYAQFGVAEHMAAQLVNLKLA